MSENATESTTTETTEDKDPKWYREQIEEKNRALAEQKAKNMKLAFDLAGIDDSKGVGKTIREMYESNGGEADKAAILEFARERFEFEPKPAAAGTDPVTQAVSDTVSAANERAAAATQGATSVDGGSDLDTQIADAEKNGDWTTAISLKNQKLAQMMSRR